MAVEDLRLRTERSGQHGDKVWDIQLGASGKWERFVCEIQGRSVGGGRDGGGHGSPGGVRVGGGPSGS